ncbi:unnamed protein product [Rotaria sp. Silwood1]|nr:unnamed protein product [Rotaria sp. Silwood1]CAF1508790.1 unnamed protein product [Rotaria sp. Silwood1]CAF3660010.1 unnamed protein product [Rotaria sp. Silwood1]CAF4912410.1 unnamed protein product [Rotaria sp. Silwood1]
MSGDLTYMSCQMATNDFVNDLKRLSLHQTANEYSNVIEHLMIQLQHATPNGLMENKPFGLAIVDNFYRVIPIFDKKLSDNNENSYHTNSFLEALSNTFNDLCLLDLFLAIKDSYCLEIIFHNYIPLLKQNYFTSDGTYDHLINCLLPIIAYSSLLVSINEADLPSNLLSYLLEFTKTNWQHKQRNKVINKILTLIKAFSRITKLVPSVIHSEWPNACIQWLKQTGPRPSYETDRLINLILQKLAQHTIAVEVLNQLNCVNALIESHEQMKIDYNEEDYSCIRFIQFITHALLIEANTIKQKNILHDELMCHVLEQMISFIISSSQNGLVFYKCCHISEILYVLSKLFVNDDILIKCLKENNQLLDCLCQLLTQYATITSNTTRVHQYMSDETLIVLANILWSISFHESYHENLKSNINFMHTLSNLATSSLLYTSTQIKTIPRDISSLKKATEGILWNLKFSYLPISKENLREQSHIMISYSHSDSIFCHELVEYLSHHIPIWVDYKQEHHNTIYSDDLWEEIAGAMETASVIVLIVSKEYHDSKSCRQELSYACDTLKKRIVPIYPPNQNYKASGWLGIRIAGQRYVHFGRKMFTSALHELLSILIVDQKSITIQKASNKMISTKSNEQETSLKNWTSKDIQKWFNDNHIHNDLITLFADRFHTGTALIVYARHLKQFYRDEYIQILANYYKTFNGKQLQTVDFITFVDALWRLREEYDSQRKIEDSLDKCDKQQSSYAINNSEKETACF